MQILKSARTLATMTLLGTVMSLTLPLSAHAELSTFLDKAEIKTKLKEEIADLDVNFKAELGDIDLAAGVNLSANYRYEVEPSYRDQYFTRIDKWDVKTDINVGDILSNVFESPFSFSIKRENSFYFVRQFKNKKEALASLPYTPKKLPINSAAALKNLLPGDFVSMPANLTIAVGAGASTSMVAPVVLEAQANVHYIVSGEFTVQVFKIDDRHVRLKIISKRGHEAGTTVSGGASFKFFGFSIVDRQIDRLFDRDLIQIGLNVTPGAQFIVDYVFDLKDEKAADAYNQILGSTLKFKDIVILNQLKDARDLKDKLISSFEKAEKVFEADKELDPKDRRVSRIFKGFNNFKGHTNHLKLALLVTSFVNDRAYTENKITYIDKNENNVEFFYPTYSKYMETKLGKWFFELKDQSFQNNFGLIPRFNKEDIKARNPDVGLTFERKDKIFTPVEQRAVQKFMISQLPRMIADDINLDEWKSGAEKRDSRIFFQLVLKSQGVPYLKAYSREEIKKRLILYVLEKKKLQVIESSETPWQTLRDFLFLSKYIRNEQLRELGDQIYEVLQNKEQDAEVMVKNIVKLNEHGIFDKLGVGFLISLLPKEQLSDLIYIKLDMIARDLRPISYEFGRLNYRALYKELNEIQSRLSNRSYDLRMTAEDQEMEQKTMEDEDHMDIETLLGLN